MICIYLLRALNEYDINCNPINNGLASKLLIYKIVENYYKNNSTFQKLSKKDKDIFIKEHINEYLINHQQKLEEKFYKYTNEIRNAIDSVALKDKGYDKGYMKIVYALSTLNNHLINGSKTYTDWISLTSNIECIFPYYDNQEYHHVAVIESCTNGVKDLYMNTLGVDVSSKESINSRNILCKKIDKDIFNRYLEAGDKSKLISDLVSLTKKDFMGYSFSKASKEISYYQYIPSNNIISVLKQLEIDLIRAEIFNFDFLKLDKKKQIEVLNKLKYFLKTVITKINDPYMIKVLENLYINNINIKYSDFNILEYDKVEHYRSKILGIAKQLPSSLIKNK